MSQLTKPQILFMLMTKQAAFPGQKKTLSHPKDHLEKAAYCIGIIKNAHKILDKQAAKELLTKKWNLTDFLTETGKLLMQRKIHV